jgi:uncharacterized protein (DUF1501 family)
VVKIVMNDQPYYYEYVSIPCVSLAFFVGTNGGGRYIENIGRDTVVEKLCADPLASVGASGCCTPRHNGCFEYRCAYAEERMPFEAALQRCSEVEWPEPSSTSTPPSNGTWYIYPETYRTSPSACPANSKTPTQEECLGAVASALAAGGEPHFSTLGNANLFVVNKANNPSGCTLNMANGRAYFNEHRSGAGSVDYKLVCDSPEDATNFTNASPLLCSRKNNRCWYSDVGSDNCQNAYTYTTDLLSTNLYYWTEEECGLNAQVNIDGRVSIVHPGSMSTRRAGLNSENWFRARWLNGHFPTAQSGCASSCSVVTGESGETCLCNIEVRTIAYFTDSGNVPSQADVEEALLIGAPAPGMFDAGLYTRCDTSACQATVDVDVYTRGTAEAPLFDKNAIFDIRVNQTRTVHLANVQSIVTIGDTSDPVAFSFRNPPQFMSLVDGSIRDAMYETDALLDHLFYHTNVAPFVAKMLIQRLVTSNPSPRYVRAVGEAFRTGQYEGQSMSGQYGDLGAATMAVVLDREARSQVLAADPTHGQVREPFVRMMHMLRAMEFVPREDREIELGQSLFTKIGQAVYKSPTVFSFFLPEFSPEGPVSSAGLVAPEAQLGVLPYVIGYLDGMSSLAFDGLSSCDGGFGGHGCSRYEYPAAWAYKPESEGYLSFVPEDATTAEAVVDELDLLLTAGRLDEHSRTVILDAYAHAHNLSSCPNERLELCGRLAVGDELFPGDSITNTNGEVLCMTYDGVARHIGANGNEIFSTFITRGVTGINTDRNTSDGRLTYYSDGTLQLWRNEINPDIRNRAWQSDDYEAGNRGVFHSFLNGPCQLLDEDAHERRVVFQHTEFGHREEDIVCGAKSTCDEGVPLTPSQDYQTSRSRTDAQYAVRVAQNLFAASAAFAVTNDPAHTQRDALVPLPRAKTGQPYKALVILYLAGGADTFNMLVPHSNCDERDVATQYTNTRGGAALPLASLKTISVPIGTQPCDTMGLHPEFTTLQQLWIDEDVSLTANVGALVEPITKQEYLDLEKRVPAGIFAHNWQTLSAKTLTPETTTGKSGILGRILNAFDLQAVASGTTPVKTAAYSINTDRTMFRGSPVEPVLLSSAEGMLTYEGSRSNGIYGNIAERAESLSDFERLAHKEAGSIFAETYNAVLRESLRDSARISELLQDATVSQDWDGFKSQAGAGKGKDLVGQLEQVARVIASREAFEAERDVFYVEMGGYDSHFDETNYDNFKGIDIALTAFTAEMKALGVWDQVVVQSSSEFGRTMTSNGAGTDHAWGGNHFTAGGDVLGGRIHGQFPELRIDGSQSISSTGVMIPTSPWESIWKPLSLWFGVEVDQLGYVMPNLHEFSPESTPDAGEFFASFVTAAPTEAPTKATEAPTMAPTKDPTPVATLPSDPTTDALIVEGSISLEGMVEANVTSNTLDALVSFQPFST